MKLTINMRLSNQTLDLQEIIKQKMFAEFLLNIGNGNYPIISGTEDSINLPLDLLMTGGDLSALINFVYSHLIENCGNVNYMVGRAILTPKNVDVEKVSEMVLNQLPGDFVVYPALTLWICLKIPIHHNHKYIHLNF